MPLFDIKNDTSAPVGAATYSAQAAPDEQDIAIMVAASQGTGCVGAPPITCGVSTTTTSTIADVTVFSGTLSNVASTTGFFSPGGTGTFWIVTSAGTAKFTYTGLTGTTFTGCTYVSGTGSVASGAAITGLDTRVTSFTYKVQNFPYTYSGFAVAYQHTDADATYDRWDLLYADNTSAVTVLAGTAAADPCLPALPVDSNGYLTAVAICAVYIPANARSITSNNLVYKNMQLSGETMRWAWTTNAAVILTEADQTRRLIDVTAAFTGVHAITLMTAASVPAGHRITISDHTGSTTGPSVGTSKEIQIKANAVIPDTINGVASTTNFEVIRDAYGSVTVQSDGVSNWDIVAVVPEVRTEIFTSTSSGGYRTPLTAKTVRAILVGSGGAGGAGQKQVVNTVTSGGGGGTAGAVTEAWINPADLSATETPTVGAAGTAPGTTTTTGAGATGGNGAAASFTIGGAIALFAAGGAGGTGGSGGTGGAGNNGATSGSGMYGLAAGGTGASGTGPVVATAGTQGAGPGTPGGGGGGGGATAAPALTANAAGGAGSTGFGTTGTGVAGGAAGTNAGTAITTLSANWFYGGGGGGGGAGRTTAGNGNAGGAGALYGGGGGGGGNGIGASGTNSNGNGGVGAKGVVVLITTR